MKRWQALVALCGLFVLGVVSGGLGAHLYYARALGRPAGPPPFLDRPLGPRLERRLGLTPEQRQELRRVLEESRLESEALRREMAPRMREVMEQTDERIRQLLTAEQRQRFEELRRTHRRRTDRFFGGREGHRGRQRQPHPDDG